MSIEDQPRELEEKLESYEKSSEGKDILFELERLRRKYKEVKKKQFAALKQKTEQNGYPSPDKYSPDNEFDKLVRNVFVWCLWALKNRSLPDKFNARLFRRDYRELLESQKRAVEKLVYLIKLGVDKWAGWTVLDIFPELEKFGLKIDRDRFCSHSLTLNFFKGYLNLLNQRLEIVRGWKNKEWSGGLLSGRGIRPKNPIRDTLLFGLVFNFRNYSSKYIQVFRETGFGPLPRNGDSHYERAGIITDIVLPERKLSEGKSGENAKRIIKRLEDCEATLVCDPYKALL